MSFSSNNQITPTVSTFSDSQVPGFIRDGSPQFAAFVKAYFEWMETQNLGPNTSSVIYNAKQLLNYKDLDTTTDGFIKYFVNDFLPYFPSEVALDERKLIKVAREFYQRKGSIESIQFLFRVLYGKEASIYLPKENILKASDGKWIRPQALRLLLEGDLVNFDVTLLNQRVGLGSVSNAQCVIEAAYKTVDPNLGFTIVDVFISNITKPFNDLESLIVNYGTPEAPLIFEEKIIAALSEIVIDPKNRGLKYNKGNPVVITGGLQPDDPLAQKAIAYVGNVTTGSLTAIKVNFGGFDYRENPNTVVTVVNAPGDNTGAGANVIVSSLDLANSTYLYVNLDAITYKANAALNSANFGFSNVAGGGNANSVINDALAYANLQFAPIRSMQVVNGGGGYQAVPTLDLAVTYYSDFTSDLANISSPDTANAIQYIDDLGYFAAVEVINGGSGYSNTTDKIVAQSAIGYNAVFDFITTGNGTISSVSVVNKGEGYFVIPTLALANSANTQNAAAGINAILQGFGYGQGANLSIGVSKIGQIIDFNLVNRGFDYIDTPNVSLRIQDVIIQSIGSNVLAYDVLVYQGTNANSTTYTAYIDNYDSANSKLRLYNYHGSFNVFQNIVATLTNQQSINLQVNVAVTGNVTTYGNGLAKANAIFLNGLIEFPGFYLNTDGQPSSDMHLEDANTYHNFSYQIIVEKALQQYKHTLMQIAHPTGMSMLGKFVIEAPLPENVAMSTARTYIPPLTGTVTSNAAAPTGVVTGIGTTFLADNIQANSIIVFNTSDSSRRLQAKIITHVNSNTSLNVESNTEFAYDHLVSVTNTSNVITSSANNLIGNIAALDVVVMNVAGTLKYSNVQSVGPTSLTVNTVFSSNQTSLVMLVLPTISGAAYKILGASA